MSIAVGAEFGSLEVAEVIPVSAAVGAGVGASVGASMGNVAGT